MLELLVKLDKDADFVTILTEDECLANMSEESGTLQ